MTQIKFGTDGWRGLIADDFTFENVRRVAGAIAGYVLKHEAAALGVGVVVGYDTRFLSDRAARAVAEVIAAAGIPVLLANDYVPTPAVSYRSEEHTSELSHHDISYAVFCLKKRRRVDGWFTLTRVGEALTGRRNTSGWA